VALAIATMVVASHLSWPATLVAAGICFSVASEWSSKLALAIRGVLLAAGDTRPHADLIIFAALLPTVLFTGWYVAPGLG
jgi:hypothetical protein